MPNNLPTSLVYAVLADLEKRLERAAASLEDQVNALRSYNPEYYRLCGKAEGARLALSYLREVDDDYIQRVS